MAAVAPKSRPRQSMTPTAAPQQQQQQQLPSPHYSQLQSPPFQSEQYFPSPNPAPYDLSPPSFTFTPAVCNYINAAVFERLQVQTSMAVRRSPQEEAKRAVIDTHFDYFQDKVNEELRRLKMEFFIMHGLRPSPNKRPPDGEPSSSYDSPDSKRPRPDDEDDEISAKGSWRCLYFEEDPESNFHCKGKRYKRVSELRRHIKTHTLPHYCEKCGYRTAEERRLQNHKCEQQNRKKYSPVTEEDRIKHEQLARMGIKVGQMRQILFGKKGDVEEEEEDDLLEDDEESSGEPSPRPSFTMPSQSQQPSQQPPQQQSQPPHQSFVPVSFPNFQPPIMASQAPLNMVTMSPSAPLYAAPHLPRMPHMPQQHIHPVHPSHTPPFHPGSVPHSPVQQPQQPAGGHNIWYYHGHHEPETNDFVLYPQATFSPNGTVTSSPPSHQSPPGDYTTYSGPVDHQPLPQQQYDLGGFLADIFGHPNPASIGVGPRAMPAEEIAEMERNLRRQGRTDTRISVAEKSRKFIRSFSTRSLAKHNEAGSAASSDKKASFWKRRIGSAPPELGTQKKEEGGFVEGVKKIFWIGVGRRRPGAADTTSGDASTAGPVAPAASADKNVASTAVLAAPVAPAASADEITAAPAAGAPVASADEITAAPAAAATTKGKPVIPVLAAPATVASPALATKEAPTAPSEEARTTVAATPATDAPATAAPTAAITEEVPAVTAEEAPAATVTATEEAITPATPATTATITVAAVTTTA